ncbi:MAG: hypothetical protein WBA12_05395, partial [Catalinimonas sp.]
PGNHDWAQGRRLGYQHLLNQEKFLESEADSLGDFFLPSGGCPGPVEVPLSDELTLLIIDSQWWLHKWEKPGEESDCDAKDALMLMDLTEEAVRRNRDRKVLVVTHHPMYSYGPHGGTYTLRQHLFPLTEVNPKLWIPFPVLGSLYPLGRSVLGNVQDIPHPRYRALRSNLTGIFRQHPHLVHAAGHEHTLQHVVRDSVHYVVSGSGCKSSPVRYGRGARFADARRGFAKLLYHYGGDVDLEFWVPTPNVGPAPAPTVERVYQTQLMHAPHDWEPEPSAPSAFDAAALVDSSVTMAASGQYRGGALRRFFLGENYRRTWRTPITVPTFDIGTAAGGLTVGKKGGGQQTRSLRLVDTAGADWVLRSVEKYPDKALPQELRGTLAADAVQDQISAAHPYGALVVPPLAAAAGLYHTNPKIVYVPNDPRFGKYVEVLRGRLALLEERPTEEHREPSMGAAEDYDSTPKVVENLREDNDDEVDQLFVLRNRLFDLVIGDWDRHDDQWRWAQFDKEGEKGHVYRPVPRDRDQALFVNEGVLPKIASRKWALPKIQGFDERVRDVAGFNFNARHFDRTFLTEPSLDDWLATADTLQRCLTDSVIDAAVRAWPPEVYELNGAQVAAKLKARRNDLPEQARRYYRFLARAVTVTGSDKHEEFLVERLSDEATRVRVWKIKKDGERKQKLYDRTFRTGETEEVRLYGLGGEDRFRVEGEVRRGPRVRIVGGTGEDRIVD